MPGHGSQRSQCSQRKARQPDGSAGDRRRSPGNVFGSFRTRATDVAPKQTVNYAYVDQDCSQSDRQYPSCPHAQDILAAGGPGGNSRGLCCAERQEDTAHYGRTGH